MSEVCINWLFNEKKNCCSTEGRNPMEGSVLWAGGRYIFGLILLPSLRSGWLRCRSWQVRAGLSWVPRGKRMVSISCRSELSEPKISSMPSLPIRNSVPAASDAGMSGSVSGSSWLASMERLDLGLLWMGRGWMTSPGGPWDNQQWGAMSEQRRI